MPGDQVGDQDTKAWNVAQEFGEELRHYSYEACPGRRGNGFSRVLESCE